MGKLLILQNDGIYLPSGEKYVAPPKPVRAQVLREYSVHPDPRFQARIDRKVGLNIFGEPLYRIVWGWGRLEWLAGLMSVYSDTGAYRGEQYGLFREPKYSYLGTSTLDRWIVEKWIHPDMYGTKESWEEETQEVGGFHTTQALGPFPSRGDYELSFAVQDQVKGEFIQLSDGLVETIVSVAEQSRLIEDSKRKQALEEEQERKEKAFKNELEEMWDDAAVAFGGRPNTTQANAPMHNTQKSIADVAKFPAPLPRGISVA